MRYEKRCEMVLGKDWEKEDERKNRDNDKINEGMFE